MTPLPGWDQPQRTFKYFAEYTRCYPVLLQRHISIIEQLRSLINEI